MKTWHIPTCPYSAPVYVRRQESNVVAISVIVINNEVLIKCLKTPDIFSYFMLKWLEYDAVVVLFSYSFLMLLFSMIDVLGFSQETFTINCASHLFWSL